MRVHVRPAHPDARIPDPAHNRFLPADGYEVEFDHHWRRHERQGNVVVSEIAAPDAPAAEAAADPAVKTKTK
jgi:hypothetical protein